jgi:hypothetical protein
MATKKDERTVPEDLSVLSDEDLAALHASQMEAFDAVYGDGQSVSDDDYERLAALTKDIKALAAEITTREGAATERASKAAELASQVRPLSGDTTGDAGDDEDDEDDDGEDDADDTDDDTQPNPEAAASTIVAAGRTQARVPKKRPLRPKLPVNSGLKMKDVAYATDGTLGVSNGEGIDWEAAGRMLDKRLIGFNRGAYAAAQARGQHMRESGSLMAFKRQMPADLVASGENADDVIARAVDISRLPGGALTAAGWCAPSEVLYDLCSTASRDGLYSIPEFGVNRGGVRWPITPSFASVYNEVGFHFTEEDAQLENYAPGATPADPNVPGPKPCIEIPCPIWDEARLEGDGLCIIGDLIQMRGYPEMMAWYMEQALIAHDHKMSANDIAKVVAGSTPVVMTAGTVGAAAPLLAAIELQVEHMRYIGRHTRGLTFEAVFPYWVHGVIRQDLSVRLGQALFDVTDAQIDAWFRSRGVTPQYVYDWQALDGIAAAAFKTWPSTVDFLIYPAGTWAKGVDDIITLDNLYDSTQLGMNKFTALFTEDASLVIKRCEESRVVTVSICGDGSTHAGVLLDCTLAPTPAP